MEHKQLTFEDENPDQLILHYFTIPTVTPIEEYRHKTNHDTFVDDLGHTALILDFPDRNPPDLAA